MFAQIILTSLLLNFGYTQEDGKFWWLNDKFSNYVGTVPPPPKYEDLNEFDNDENAKIVFDDNNLIMNKIDVTERGERLDIGKTSGQSNGNGPIKWSKVDNVVTSTVPVQHFFQKNDAGDKLTFKFPESENYSGWNDTEVQIDEVQTAAPVNTHLNLTSTTDLFDKISINVEFEDKMPENICTYMRKIDCYRNKGVQHYDIRDQKRFNINNQVICCNLALRKKKENPSSNIYFPGTSIRRPKRSEENQRRVLIRRKYALRSRKNKPETKSPEPEYEYDDPYWNIKNLKKQVIQKQKPSTAKYDYVNDDYFEDYAVEVPKPGLKSFYSDKHDKRISIWTSSKQNKSPRPSYGGSDEDVSGILFSTIDPRIGISTTKKSRHRGRPLKLTTVSEENSHDVESQTISYQSHPDFNVLPDFKLLNLRRKKPHKVSRSTTTESFSSISKEQTVGGPLDKSTEANSNTFIMQQVYKSCGRTANPLILNEGKQIGDTLNGSHPWLAFLVPTRRLSDILCYATLIHPRAAITAARCVHRSSPGQITLVVGVWNLNENSQAKTRVISTLLHPEYKKGELHHNLAILHWERPMKLTLNVQPVCLANPQYEDNCIFVGWGGFDQAIRPEARWQRASIHSCKGRLSLVDLDLPSNAFCASVQARNTITGIGGSLVCSMHDRPAAVGVAVCRNSTLVLLPALEWVSEALTSVLNL